MDIATQTRGVAMWLLYCNDLMVVATRLRDMATNLRVVAAWIRYNNKIRIVATRLDYSNDKKELAHRKP